MQEWGSGTDTRGSCGSSAVRQKASERCRSNRKSHRRGRQGGRAEEVWRSGAPHRLEVKFAVVHVVAIRDGKVARLDIHISKAKALEAAGLRA
jgi:hypothetical protein